MTQRGARRPPQGPGEAFHAGATKAAYPQPFFSTPQAGSSSGYDSDPSVQKLIRFFTDKGLAALKDEDAREAWYADWLAYQAAHRLYASVLSSKRYSGIGAEFDLLRFTRFLEVFAYFSPAHAYSLQVSYLGLFAILMGGNDALKR